MAGDESHTNVDELQVARAHAVELQRGTVLAGRYEIETVLGRGGAGVVLRAHDRELAEAVAIKVLRPELGGSSRWIERLAREVKLARQLRHPNVCRVFDFEKADGYVFIVMELATRGTLRHELQADAADGRPLDARLADARAVVAGLGAIHEAGIVHRDVTPQNILRMGDGRVVVSDFGLATEVSQTTTSVHGGTIAYMAPEVVRGQRATYASDVWALGVVIHEIVFGARPSWTKSVGGALVVPGGGRALTRPERLAFDVCRACTEEEPARRPATAGEVAAWLEGGKVARRAGRLRWIAPLALGVLGAGFAGWSLLAPARAPRASNETHKAPVVGDAADWSSASRVIATIDARLKCMTGLPDGRTLRYVYGSPPRAEDLDTSTGLVTPSPVVPATYEQGCPEVSPDGRRLAYQGFTADGRAYAFLSEHGDGSDATPVTPIADPSMDSEPRWLPNGEGFVVEVDQLHMGIFALDARRTTILPEPVHEPYVTSFSFVVGPKVFVTAVLADEYSSEVVGYSWPIVSEESRLRLPWLVIDLMSPDKKTLLGIQSSPDEKSTVMKIDPVAKTATRLGKIGGQFLRYLRMTSNGLAFESRRQTSDIWTKDATGHLAPLTRHGTFIDVAPCGPDLIATRHRERALDVLRLSRSGETVAELARGTLSGYPVCSPDGRAWYVTRWNQPMGIDRCDDHGCKQIAAGAAAALDVSPDGTRMLFSLSRPAGTVVVWMPIDGGPTHDVSPTETNCSVGWSSNRAVWISRRRAGQLRWIEVDADTGRETGKSQPGSTDCADATPDAQSPVHPDLRVVYQNHTEIRLIPLPVALR